MVDRIILHAGTPKTGTTSLQIALAECRDALAAHGIVYPTAMQTSYTNKDGSVGIKPKHQWLVSDLLAEDSILFKEHMRAAISQALPSDHTLILSTEGLFNHWWDFSAAGRSALTDLAQQSKLEVWVWFRHPVPFITSHYVQMLKNDRSWVTCHGQDWSPDQMLDDPWFSKHLDYIGFTDEVGALLGPEAVRLFAYRRTTVADFMQAIGLHDLRAREPAENATIGVFGVETLRRLNGLDPPPEARGSAISLIARLDAELGDSSPSFRLADSTRARVVKMSNESINRLTREFDLNLSEPI